MQSAVSTKTLNERHLRFIWLSNWDKRGTQRIEGGEGGQSSCTYARFSFRLSAL